ncbi:MAG: chlorite dismutase family protein [Gemmatimonadaceae bacterium]
MTLSNAAHPPETLEGWYALPQIYRIERGRAEGPGGEGGDVFQNQDDRKGWSEAVGLIGSSSDVMFMHFRPTLDEIGSVQRDLARQPWMKWLVPTYSFLSVTEAGLYHITAKLAKEAEERGGKVGDAEYVAAAKARAEVERSNAFIQKRLYPTRPAAMPYVSFYPMSKRRQSGQNWYTLPTDERSRMMYEHGMTGRRYAGKVQQIITGAIGFDAWEWGVTLFASDPLDFKKLVSEMRFDEASAAYAEFGSFYVGRAGTLAEVLGG